MNQFTLVLISLFLLIGCSAAQKIAVGTDVANVVNKVSNAYSNPIVASVKQIIPQVGQDVLINTTVQVEVSAQGASGRYRVRQMGSNLAPLPFGTWYAGTLPIVSQIMIQFPAVGRQVATFEVSDQTDPSKYVLVYLDPINVVAPAVAGPAPVINPPDFRVTGPATVPLGSAISFAKITILAPGVAAEVRITDTQRQANSFAYDFRIPPYQLVTSTAGLKHIEVSMISPTGIMKKVGFDYTVEAPPATLPPTVIVYRYIKPGGQYTSNDYYWRYSQYQNEYPLSNESPAQGNKPWMLEGPMANMLTGPRAGTVAIYRCHTQIPNNFYAPQRAEIASEVSYLGQNCLGATFADPNPIGYAYMAPVNFPGYRFVQLLRYVYRQIPTDRDYVPNHAPRFIITTHPELLANNPHITLDGLLGYVPVPASEPAAPPPAIAEFCPFAPGVGVGFPCW